MGFTALPKDSNLVPFPSIYVPNVGWVVMQGSTNTNTDGSTNQSTPVNFNLTQVGSQLVTLDALNNLTVQHFIDYAILAGKAFSATTGAQTSGGTLSTGTSLFNPGASGKTIYLYSARAQCSNGQQHTMVTDITIDPALASALTITNRKHGGATSIASATFANAATTFTGNTADFLSTGANTPTDFLAPNELVVIPPGSGIGLRVGTSSNVWGTTLKWLEL